MNVNTNIIVAGSQFSGFKNYSSNSSSLSLDAFLSLPEGTNVLIGANSYVGPVRITIPLNNNNAVSEVQIQYANLDTFYRKIPGSLSIDYPTSSTRTYEMQTLTYFTGGLLYIDNYVINETGSPVTVPPIVFNCRAFLYAAPF